MFHRIVNVVAEGRIPAVDPQKRVNGDKLLSHLTRFIGRYLRCSDDQLTLMALWVLHTYCLPAAQVTPYLSIQSAHKQSGKTLCLQLLNLLCEHPALTAAFTPSTFTLRITERIVSAVLLDECHATLGTRARSKGPVLRAILNAGYNCGAGYTAGPEEREVFCPKAFAGQGQLPQDLADRSFPIILKQLESRQNVERFHLRRAILDAEPLKRQLQIWSTQNLKRLREMQPYSEEAFPPNLSPRRQDMCEPLLQLADAIGGEWPACIRHAVTAVFAEAETFALQPSLQLLADLRDCFAHHNFPERLSTAAVLDWMRSLPARPWDVDGHFSAHTLARLLGVFQISPRMQRMVSARSARGYQLEDFRQPWKKHLGFELGTSEIANKDALCCDVALSGAPALPQAPGKAADCLSGSCDLVEKGGKAEQAALSPVPYSLSPNLGESTLPSAYQNV